MPVDVPGTVDLCSFHIERWSTDREQEAKRSGVQVYDVEKNMQAYESGVLQGFGIGLGDSRIYTYVSNLEFKRTAVESRIYSR